MISWEDGVGEALEAYPPQDQDQIHDLAVAFSGESRTVSVHLLREGHKALVRFRDGDPLPPKPSFLHYFINQLGTALVGGAVGLLIAAPREIEWIITYSLLLAAGLCLAAGTRER